MTQTEKGPPINDTHTRGFNLGIFAFSLGTSSFHSTPPPPPLLPAAADADAAVITTTAGHAISVTQRNRRRATRATDLGERCFEKEEEEEEEEEMMIMMAFYSLPRRSRVW